MSNQEGIVEYKAIIRGHPPLYYIINLRLALGVHYWIYPLSITIPNTSYIDGDVLRIGLGFIIGISGIVLNTITIV